MTPYRPHYPHLSAVVPHLDPPDHHRFLLEFADFTCTTSAPLPRALSVLIAKARANDPLTVAWEALVLDLHERPGIVARP